MAARRVGKIGIHWCSLRVRPQPQQTVPRPDKSLASKEDSLWLVIEPPRNPVVTGFARFFGGGFPGLLDAETAVAPPEVLASQNCAGLVYVYSKGVNCAQCILYSYF